MHANTAMAGTEIFFLGWSCHVTPGEQSRLTRVNELRAGTVTASDLVDCIHQSRSAGTLGLKESRSVQPLEDPPLEGPRAPRAGPASAGLNAHNPSAHLLNSLVFLETWTPSGDPATST